MPISRRELYLDHGRVSIECPRLMSDEELADVLEAFVKDVRVRQSKPAPCILYTGFHCAKSD
jgi:hypothetical protein